MKTTESSHAQWDSVDQVLRFRRAAVTGVDEVFVSRDRASAAGDDGLSTSDATDRPLPYATYRLALDRGRGTATVVHTRASGPVEIELDELHCRILDECQTPRLRDELLKATIEARVCEPSEAKATLAHLIATDLLAQLGEVLVTVPVRTFDHRLLCLAGPTCAGKTTAVAEARKSGLEIFDVGTELQRKYGRELAYLDPIPRLAAIGDGQSVLAGLREALVGTLRSGRPVVIDSVKAAGDVPALARLFPGAGILVLGISAPLEVRRQRFYQRNRPGDESSMDMKDAKLLSIGVDRVIGDVDVEITNDGKVEEYRTALASFFERARTSFTPEFWRRSTDGSLR